MRYPHRPADEVHLRDASQFPFYPRSSEFHALLAFQSERKINDVASGFLGHAPGIAREIVVRGKKREVNVLHMLGQDTLYEGRLVANGFQLPKGLIVIEETYVVRGKVPLVQYVLELATLECASTHDRNAEQAAPTDGVGTYNRYRFGS